MIKCRLPKTYELLDIPQVGDHIWRGLKHGIPIATPFLQVGNNHMVRGLKGGRKIQSDNWIVSTKDRGLAIFVYGDIPIDWTYLEVFEVAGSGTAVHAAAVAGSAAEHCEVYGKAEQCFLRTLRWREKEKRKVIWPKPTTPIKPMINKPKVFNEDICSIIFFPEKTQTEPKSSLWDNMLTRFTNWKNSSLVLVSSGMNFFLI